jgi:hypothetical protein
MSLGGDHYAQDFSGLKRINFYFIILFGNIRMAVRPGLAYASMN